MMTKREKHVDIGGMMALRLLHGALISLAYSLTPLVGGIVLVGIILAVVQGAFQIEDGALAMGGKLAIVLVMAGSAVVTIYLTLEQMAHHWIHDIPVLIARHWS